MKRIIQLIFLLITLDLTLTLPTNRTNDCSNVGLCKQRLQNDVIKSPNNCQCDSLCDEYGDCCLDSEYYSRDGTYQARDKWACVELRNYGGVYMKTDCPRNYENNNENNSEIAKLCRLDPDDNADPIGTSIVTSRYSNSTYKNYYCALCNDDVSDLAIWPNYVSCNGIAKTTRLVNLRYNEVEGVWGVYMKTGTTGRKFMECNIDNLMLHSASHIVRKCKVSVDECAPNWIDDEVSDACRSYTQLVYINNVAYKNPHCLMCNNIQVQHVECEPSKRSRQNNNWRTLFETNSFAVIFDVNERTGNDVGLRRLCESGEIWDPFFRQCRTLVCGWPGYVVREGKCVNIKQRNVASIKNNAISNTRSLPTTMLATTPIPQQSRMLNFETTSEVSTSTSESPNNAKTSISPSTSNLPELSPTSTQTHTTFESINEELISVTSFTPKSITQSHNHTFEFTNEILSSTSATLNPETSTTSTSILPTLFPTSHTSIESTSEELTSVSPNFSINDAENTTSESSIILFENPMMFDKENELFDTKSSNAESTYEVSPSTTPNPSVDYDNENITERPLLNENKVMLDNVSESNSVEDFSESSFIIPLNFSEYFISCVKIAVSRGNFDISPNGTVKITKYDRVLENGSYDINADGSVLICVDSVEGLGLATINKFSFEMSLFSIVLLGTSWFFLLIHLISYACIPKCRNLSGNNLLCFCICQLFAYAGFLIGSSAGLSGVYCKIVASVTYYAFLAASFWITIISFDVVRTMYKTIIRLHKIRGMMWKRFTCYSLIAWLGPAVILAGALTCDLYLLPEFRPRFGEVNCCWFGNKKALLYFYTIPFIILFSLCLAFFAINLYLLCSSRPNESLRSHGRAEKINSFTYFKLFVITGMNWLFGIIAGFTDVEALWYLFDFFFCLHGLFIFLTFTCSDKMLGGVFQRVFKSDGNGLTRKITFSSTFNFSRKLRAKTSNSSDSSKTSTKTLISVISIQSSK